MQVGEIRPATVDDFKQLLDIVFSHDGWEAKPNKGGVKVWTKSVSSSPVKMIKLAVDFDDISALTLYDVLHDPQYRAMWDESMIEGLDIYKLDDFNDIGYYSLRCPPPMKNRDFVNQRSWGIFGDDHMIMNHTIDIEEMPVKKDFIRGVSYLTGYIVRRCGSGCSVHYITQNDPGGQVPKWILNRVSSVIAPKVLEKIYKAALSYDEWKGKNDPNWRPWRGIGQDKKPLWPKYKAYKLSNSTRSLEAPDTEPADGAPEITNGTVDQYGSLDSLAPTLADSSRDTSTPDEIIGNVFSVGDKEVTNGDSKRPPLVRHESITIRRGKEEEPSSPGEVEVTNEEKSSSQTSEPLDSNFFQRGFSSNEVHQSSLEVSPSYSSQHTNPPPQKQAEKPTDSHRTTGCYQSIISQQATLSHQPIMSHHSNMSHQQNMPHQPIIAHQQNMEHQPNMPNLPNMIHQPIIAHQQNMEHLPNMIHQPIIAHQQNMEHQPNMPNLPNMIHQPIIAHQQNMEHQPNLPNKIHQPTIAHQQNMEHQPNMSNLPNMTHQIKMVNQVNLALQSNMLQYQPNISQDQSVMSPYLPATLQNHPHLSQSMSQNHPTLSQSMSQNHPTLPQSVSQNYPSMLKNQSSIPQIRTDLHQYQTNRPNTDPHHNPTLVSQDKSFTTTIVIPEPLPPARSYMSRTDSLDTNGSQISDLCHSISQLTKGEEPCAVETSSCYPPGGSTVSLLSRASVPPDSFASVTVSTHPIDPDCCSRVSRHVLGVYGVGRQMTPSRNSHRTKQHQQVDTIPEKSEYRIKKKSKEPEGLESSSYKFFNKMSSDKSRHRRKKKHVPEKSSSKPPEPLSVHGEYSGRGDIKGQTVGNVQSNDRTYTDIDT